MQPRSRPVVGFERRIQGKLQFRHGLFRIFRIFGFLKLRHHRWLFRRFGFEVIPQAGRQRSRSSRCKRSKRRRFCVSWQACFRPPLQATATELSSGRLRSHCFFHSRPTSTRADMFPVATQAATVAFKRQISLCRQVPGRDCEITGPASLKPPVPAGRRQDENKTRYCLSNRTDSKACSFDKKTNALRANVFP